MHPHQFHCPLVHLSELSILRIVQGDCPGVNSFDVISATELDFKKFSFSSAVHFPFLFFSFLSPLFL